MKHKSLTSTALVFCSLLSACATTGGFDLARKQITAFSDGAAAGKTYVDARNEKMWDAKRLLMLQWHTAYLPAGVTRVAIGVDADKRPIFKNATSLNNERILQPDDKRSSGLIDTLAQSIVCTPQMHDEKGALLMHSTADIAASIKEFDYKAADTSVGNLAILFNSPTPDMISVKGADLESAINVKIEKERQKCVTDYNKAKLLSTGAAPIASEGGTESLTGTVTALYAAYKELDKVLAIPLAMLADYKRRAEFNAYVKNNKAGFKELKSKLDDYATRVNDLDQAEVKETAMQRYIFAFEKFANEMLIRERQATQGLFKLNVADVSTNKNALAVITAANSYTSAKNADPAKAVTSLSKTIDNIIALTDKPDANDIYAQYKAGKEFLEALSKLADATQDEDLKEAVRDAAALF